MSINQGTTLREGVSVKITAAELKGDFKLHLKFDDGIERDIDFQPFLQSSANPQIRTYLEPAKFQQFEMRDGDLVWGDYELCFPIADLYEGRI